MKKFLSCNKAAIVLLVATLISLGFYVFTLARPISYGMSYNNKSEYAGMPFEGSLTFYADGTTTTVNSNFDEAIKSRYYYKNGYVFSIMAQTDEAYEEEIAYIDENFDDAVNTPFYASKINAFRQISKGTDGYTLVYTCASAIVVAVVVGIVEIILIGLTCAAWILNKKSDGAK